MTASTSRAARMTLIGLAALGVTLASLPMASADYTCTWDAGPIQFKCTGERGCAPGAGFTPQGAVFVGCAAWD